MSISDCVDRLHRRLQLALDHAVELERLARGEAQRPVGVARRDRVERQPLLRGAHAAGQARADHETVGRLELLQAPLLAQVAIVLLVAAVELDQLRVVFAQRAGDGIGEALDQRAAQAAAGRLDVLDG